MTTAPDHHEQDPPLSAEERELAARLGRIGPVDGPSPALDAKILAAAHAAAVTRSPKRHRPFAWLGIPPALVTGVGVAAAAVLVLGVVWQVRPQYGGFAAQGEADAGEEIILIAPPSDASSRALPPPPPPPPAPEPAPAPQRAAAAARTAEATASRSQRQAPAAAATPASAPAPAVAAEDEVALAVQPAAPPRAADAQASAATSEEGFAPEPSEYRRPTYTTAARADAERRERSTAQKAAAAAEPPESTTLDRIEVTGSRIGPRHRYADVAVDWSRVPTSEDARLAPVEWLERIRDRRDAGDTDNARASLKLFQREYPRIRLPDDLRALLADTKQ